MAMSHFLVTAKNTASPGWSFLPVWVDQSGTTVTAFALSL